MRCLFGPFRAAPAQIRRRAVGAWVRRRSPPVPAEACAPEARVGTWSGVPHANDGGSPPPPPLATATDAALGSRIRLHALSSVHRAFLLGDDRTLLLRADGNHE